MVDPTPYTPEFYAAQRGGSLSSADVVLDAAFALLGRPASVVDVGCGVGTWLKAAAARGVADYLGLDGAWAPESGLEIPAEHFLAADLTEGRALLPRLPRPHFDLCLCLEVAEHLPAEHAGALIGLLTGVADAVVFSAAIPDQGGTDHVNEQWPDYWARLFAEQDFLCFDVLRPRIWSAPGIEWWYAQNALVFARRESAAARHLAAQAAPVDPPMPLVHPGKYNALRRWAQQAWAQTADARFGVLEQKLATLHDDIARLTAAHAAAQDRSAREADRWRAEADRWRNEAAVLRASTSWRATAPLRFLAAMAPHPPKR